MPSVEDSAHLASDAELITSVRAGDRQAFGDLYSRHASAAAGLARQFARSSAEADDLVSEAFARVLDGLLEGKGPDTAFRAYLFTTVRNTAYDRSRKDKRLQFTDDIESHDQPVELDDPVIADLENGLVGRAFAGLPERWQTVLWHVQVEGQSPAEVGVLMGMAPNAVSSLAFRAREGLREAYLQAHLAETAAQQCRTTVDRLGAWTRGGLSKRERAQVDAHLQVCDRCPALAAELSEINTSLRGLLAPLLLGGAAAGYIATLPPIAPLVQLGTFTGGSTVVGSSTVSAVTPGSSSGAKAVAGKVFGSKAGLALAKVGPWAPGAALAGAVAVTAGVVAAIILSLSGGSAVPAVAGSQAPVPVAGSTFGGAGGGNLPGGGGTNGGGGSNGGGSNGGGTDVVTNDGGSNGGGGNGGGSNGGGSNGGGGNGGGGSGGGGTGTSGSRIAPVIPTTTGVTGNTGNTTVGGAPSSGPNAGSGPDPAVPVTASTAPGGTVNGTGPGGVIQGIPGTEVIGTDLPGAGNGGTDGSTTNGLGTDGLPPGTTGGPGIGGQPSNPLSTPAGTPDSTDGSTTPSTVGDGATSTTAESTTSGLTSATGTTSSGTVPVVPTTSTTASTPSTPTTSTTTTATTPSTTSTTSTPSTPRTPSTTSTATSTSATSTSVPVTPAAPALLSVSSSAVSDAVAGSAVTVSVTIANTGGSASAAGGSVVIRVPTGLTIGAVTLGSPLRTSFAFAAAVAPRCTQQGSEVTCSLTPIAPLASLVLSVPLDVAPDAADGNIEILLNGAESGTIALVVQSGYAGVQLSSAADLPLAPAAVNRVALVAIPKPDVRNPGAITLASTDFAVVGVSGDGGACTVAAGTVSCLAAAAQAGVTLDVAVKASATDPPVLTATDQRGRAATATTDLTVDRTGIGGYRSVRIGNPGHLLRAGSIDILTLTATTLNAGVVNAGPITVPVQLSPGVRIAARPGSALPAGCLPDADTITCTPADGPSTEFSLPVQVSAAATGAQQLADAVLPAGTAHLGDGTDPLIVDPARSGYDRITLAATSPLAAGTMGTLALGAVVGDGVTEPGPVRIPRQLAPGLLVTAATGCDRDGEEFRCPPGDGAGPAPTLTVAVLPLASSDTVLAPAGLDGNRQQGIAGSLPVVPRAPGQRIELTGPFGGTSVGAPILRCEKTEVDTRNGCPGGLTTVPASSATLTVPAGATVVSAELTWAATAPAAIPVSTLDTVDVAIDGSDRGTVHGVRPAGVSADVTGGNPVTSGQLFQRVATADAQQLLAAGASPGTHTVTISNLAARTTAGRTSAMGAWSLTVLWSTSSTADVGVLTDNRGLFSRSTRAGAVTEIEPAGRTVTAIYQTIWAADPWGIKTLAIGDTAVANRVNGRHGLRLDGFDLLHPSLPESGLAGSITFVNRLTPPAALHPDGLWIGPTLVITVP